MEDRRTSWRRRGRWLLLVSLVLAVAASAFALFGPTGRYEEGMEEAVPEGSLAPQRVTETGWTTLLGQIRSGEEDASVLVWLVVPIAVATVPVVLAKTRFDPAARTVAAVLLLAFSFVTGFSIGLFYMPSGWSMLAAAVVGWSTQD